MKEHPILFSGEMVRAILQNRKFQTRRVINPQPQWPWDKPPVWVDGDGYYHSGDGPHLATRSDMRCPYGAVGDTLWVREAWRTEKNIDKMDAAQMVAACLDAGYSAPWAPIRYEADGRFDNWDQGQEVGRLRPSIHMPRWASRITLEVVNVRVERVQEISEADAKAEGVWKPGEIVRADMTGRYDAENYTARNQFMHTWEHLNFDRGFGWNVDPWVWVIEFKRVRP